jgi:hypothetical protein
MQRQTKLQFFPIRTDMKQSIHVRWPAVFAWVSLLAVQTLICVPFAPGQQEQSPSSSSSNQPDTEKQSPSTSQPAADSQPASQTGPPTTDIQESPPSTHDQPKPTTKPVTRKHSTKKRSPTKKAPADHSGKVVVRNGGAKDNSGLLTPAMTQEQKLHSRENTAQLLATTDSNLKAVAGRQLSESQQGMLDQIRAYVQQSKTASDAGDLPRAHTLAYKAHLLSDELVRK